MNKDLELYNKLDNEIRALERKLDSINGKLEIITDQYYNKLNSDNVEFRSVEIKPNFRVDSGGGHYTTKCDSLYLVMDEEMFRDLCDKQKAILETKRSEIEHEISAAIKKFSADINKGNETIYNMMVNEAGEIRIVKSTNDIETPIYNYEFAGDCLRVSKYTSKEAEVIKIIGDKAKEFKECIDLLVLAGSDVATQAYLAEIWKEGE